MRIVFDMDGTLVGAWERPRGAEYRLNTRLYAEALELKRDGHEVILWTFGNREWWRIVRAWWPELLEVFDEVYTRDDDLGKRINRTGVYHLDHVKDIRRINADLLIDNDPIHKRWAERKGMGEQYVVVRTYGGAA